MKVIGATGKFPDGKMCHADVGELRFGIAHASQGNVHVNFGKDVSWFSMPRSTAIELGKLILTHAGAKRIAIDF